MITVLFGLLRAQTNDATQPKKNPPVNRFKTVIASVEGCNFLIAKRVGKKYKGIKAIIDPQIMVSKLYSP